jgi:hypothetical protein
MERRNGHLKSEGSRLTRVVEVVGGAGICKAAGAAGLGLCRWVWQKGYFGAVLAGKYVALTVGEA